MVKHWSELPRCKHYYKNKDGDWVYKSSEGDERILRLNHAFPNYCPQCNIYSEKSNAK